MRSVSSSRTSLSRPLVVALRRRRVAQPEAVQQHRGVVSPHAAGLNGHQLARPSQLPHLGTRQRAQRRSQAVFGAIFELLVVDHVHAFRQLLAGLGQAGGGYQHLGGNGGETQLDREAGVGAALQVDSNARRRRKLRRRGLHHVIARRQVRQAEGSVGCGDCRKTQRAVARDDANFSAGDQRAGRVEYRTAERGSVSGRHQRPDQKQDSKELPRPDAFHGLPGKWKFRR